VALTGQGYEIDDAKSGDLALEKVRDQRFDLILLDMNMPGMGGLETCRIMREQSEVAIIMLTVRDSESDKVDALDAGADDYVTKPFKTSELLARIRAALRRLPSMPGPSLGVLTLGEVTIDFDSRQITSANSHMHLTPREFELLRYLVTHSNRVLTHRELLQGVWGPDYGEEVDALRVVVNQLRKKIEPQPSKPVFLVTEPWVGYRMALPSARQRSA